MIVDTVGFTLPGERVGTEYTRGMGVRGVEAEDEAEMSGQGGVRGIAIHGGTRGGRGGFLMEWVWNWPCVVVDLINKVYRLSVTLVRTSFPFF